MKGLRAKMIGKRISSKKPQNDEEGWRLYNTDRLLDKNKAVMGITGESLEKTSAFDIPCSLFDIRFS